MLKVQLNDEQKMEDMISKPVKGYCNQLENNILNTINKSDIRPYGLELYSEEKNEPTPLKMTFRKAKINSEAYELPITYQRRQIGSICLSNQAKISSGHHQINQLTQRIAHLVSRYQVGQLSERHLGRKITLIGQSSAISHVESFIEKASCAICPVMIVGEPGTDKLAVAISIHFNGRYKSGAFIEIDCNSVSEFQFRSYLENKLKHVTQGTLFLNDIDMLDGQQQAILLETIALPSCNPQSAPHQAKKFNIIAASTKNIKNMTNDGDFSKRLYDELSFLEVLLPSLKERVQDIPPLIDRLLKRFKLYEQQSLSFEVIDALQNFSWPGNEIQMERDIARLLTLSDTNPININDLKKHLPNVINDQVHHRDSDHGSIESLIQDMMNKELSLYSGMHNGLFKALDYITHNYEKEITLSKLAENVFVSASHLSYLFKHHLNKSFKQVLSELRIEHAKNILSQSPYSRITDIFLEVGFGDLSHFEKIFKRHTGLTPRAFKKKAQLQRQL